MDAEASVFLEKIFEQMAAESLPVTATPPGVVMRAKDSSSRARYGVTDEEVGAILAAQDDRCAICRRQASEDTPLVVDHDHALGPVRAAVRGLLCRRCNAAIGLFGDDPASMRRAIDYILTPPAQALIQVNT